MKTEEAGYKPQADGVETDARFSELSVRSLEVRKPLFQDLKKKLIEIDFPSTFDRFLILGLASGKEAILVSEYLSNGETTITGVDLYNDLDPIIRIQYPDVHLKIEGGKNIKIAVFDFLNDAKPTKYDFVLVSTGRRHGIFTTHEANLLSQRVEENGLVVTVGDSTIAHEIMEPYFSYQFTTEFLDNPMFEVWKKNA